jgi:hypothetical protein
MSIVIAFVLGVIAGVLPTMAAYFDMKRQRDLAVEAWKREAEANETTVI